MNKGKTIFTQIMSLDNTYEFKKCEPVQIHTLMNLRGSIPTFIHLTHGLVHDSKIMDKFTAEANA